MEVKDLALPQNLEPMHQGKSNCIIEYCCKTKASQQCFIDEAKAKAEEKSTTAAKNPSSNRDMQRDSQHCNSSQSTSVMRKSNETII